MKIVVCVKYVPDAQAARRFDPTDHTVDRVNVDGILSELDEYAVEAALQIQESRGGPENCSVTVLTIGPERASDAVRRSLQMGADAGVHILDPAIHGSDAPATSALLAAALRRIEHDLVLFGMASTDAGMSAVPVMVAERLGLPALTLAGELTLDGTTVRIRRDGDTSSEIIEGSLPAVVSVTDWINQPRYPSFKGIMAAKKKPQEVWSLADLDVSVDDVGLDAAWTAVTDVTARPARQAGQVVTDDGDGATRLVEYLAAAKLV